VNPVIIQPGASTSALTNNDNSYQYMQRAVAQSTSNSVAKRFSFTFNSRDQPKASRPNKHSKNGHSTKNATLSKVAPGPVSVAHHQQQALATKTSMVRDPSANKSAAKGKSVSAKKGKIFRATSQNETGKNLNFDKVGVRTVAGREQMNSKLKVKTPQEVWLLNPRQSDHEIVAAQRHDSRISSPSCSSVVIASANQHGNVQAIPRLKKKRTLKNRRDASRSDSIQRDSIVDESSILQPERSDSERRSENNPNFDRLAYELQMKDNLIQQLYTALSRKDEQVLALTKNCEALQFSLKERDAKRDRSQ